MKLFGNKGDNLTNDRNIVIKHDLDIGMTMVKLLQSEPPAQPVVCSRPIRAHFRRLSLKTR